MMMMMIVPMPMYMAAVVPASVSGHAPVGRVHR